MFHALEHIMPPLSSRFFPSDSFSRDNSARFITGTALISVSFLVYLAYPVILLILPLGKSTKVVAVIAVWILSWAVFSAGIFLAGPDGFRWFKGLWLRLTRSRVREKNYSSD